MEYIRIEMNVKTFLIFSEIWDWGVGRYEKKYKIAFQLWIIPYPFPYPATARVSILCQNINIVYIIMHFDTEFRYCKRDKYS